MVMIYKDAARSEQNLDAINKNLFNIPEKVVLNLFSSIIVK